MLLFILARRAWRSGIFRRKDRFRAHWWKRLPALLAGATPTPGEMRSRMAREVLETLLLLRLQTAEERERKQISELIHRAGLLDYRLQMLRRGSRWNRLHSAAVVGQFRSAAAVPALAQALEDPWQPMQTVALQSLGLIGASTAGPAVLRFLRRGAPVEANLWIEAAVACVPKPEDLLRLLLDERSQVRALAARAIAEHPRPLSLESLRPLTFDPDPEIRAQAMRALGRSSDSPAIALLISGTLDPVWFVRLRALVALNERGDASALDAVLRATGDPNFSVRQRAAATLATLASRPGAVLEMLASANDRYALEGFLTQLARTGFLWHSLPLLTAPEERTRRDAEGLLGAAVSAGYHQVVLNAVETHPDWRVRVAAARLLARFSTPALRADLQERIAAAPNARLRRLLRAVSRRQLSLAGDKIR